MEDRNIPVQTTEDHIELELLKTSKEETIKGRQPECSCDTFCGLSNQANHKSESERRSKSSRKLGGLVIFCLIFIVVEVVGGIKANSLAVLTDAAHLLTDATGFCISLFAVWASGWKATPRHSFGFFRLEVLGTLLSVLLIWLIVGCLIYEAIGRFWRKNVVVNGRLMFVTASFGLLINLIMLIWLGHDHGHHSHDHNHHGHVYDEHCAGETEGTEETPLVSSHHGKEHKCDDQVQNQSILDCILYPLRRLKQTHINMNVQGAYLHIIGDLIQSIGVMIGGLVIWEKPNWLLVDLICTIGFSVLVLLTTKSIIRDIFLILMESAPVGIDADKIEAGLLCIRGVQAVHDLHIWAISVEKTLLLCHIIAEQGANSNEILNQARDYCKGVYGIQHVTVQIELEQIHGY